MPTFFEAIRPHLHKNHRGPGMAAGVEHLARKLGQDEADFTGALQECGFTIPQEASGAPAYLEYDGDLYWLNRNARGQLWINVRPKPRPVFRAVAGRKVAADELPGTGLSAEGSAKPEDWKPESLETDRKEPAEEYADPSALREPHSATGPADLPAGPALLDRLRPMMRRSRRGSGLSGSVNFLARALKTGAAQLEEAFVALGLVQSGEDGEPVFAEIDGFVYWLNQDKSGQTWINCRKGSLLPGTGDRRPESAQPELPLAVTENARPKSQNPEPSGGASPLAAVRLLLKETKRGGYAAEFGRLAAQLGKNSDELLAVLTAAGLKAPEKAREKPVFAEHAGEIFWLNRNARGELWLNAKASKYAEESEGGEDAAGRTARRGRKKEGA